MKSVERIVLICVILVGSLLVKSYGQSDSAGGFPRDEQRQERQHVNSSGDMQQEMQDKLDKTNQLYDKITQKIQQTKDPGMKADLSNLQTQLGSFRNDLNNYMSTTGSQVGKDQDHVRQQLRSEFENIKNNMNNFRNKYGEGKGDHNPGNQQMHGQRKRENGGIQVPPSNPNHQ